MTGTIASTPTNAGSNNRPDANTWISRHDNNNWTSPPNTCASEMRRKLHWTTT
jgi:hypothetical protein